MTPGDRGLRRAALRSVLAGWLSVAPYEVPVRRWLPGERPAVGLAVGEPTPSIAYRVRRGRGGETA